MTALFSGSALTQKRCKPCEGGMPALDEQQVRQLLQSLSGWERRNGEIRKLYRFRNYHETIAFVNAIAWMAHREDHHPDLEVGYNTCTVRYSTHAINGLSENDFICAAKVEQLLQ
jgi:4a-hydroxytetrahydrobiopterin dehydratase